MAVAQLTALQLVSVHSLTTKATAATCYNYILPILYTTRPVPNVQHHKVEFLHFFLTVWLFVQILK